MGAFAQWAYSTIAPPREPHPYPRDMQHPYIHPSFQHLAAQRTPAAPELATSKRPLKILHIIGSLGPGGAELQLCHSAIGLKHRGYEVRVATLDALTGPSAFRLPALQKAGIEVATAGQAHGSADAATHQAILQIPHISHIIHDCPNWLRPVTIDLLAEILRDPPDRLHAWLDWTNIAGAAAALAARVPQILLSVRNVNPTHPPFSGSPWYRPWYQFLATVPRITWISNSQAGALDYANWLDMDPTRFHIIRNGLDTQTLRRSDDAAVQTFRQTLGIPTPNPAANQPPAQIVAGVFRLRPEKQPLLFVEVVERVIRQLPNVHAVLAGDGPLEQAVRDRVAASPSAARWHLLGLRHDIPLILSAADVLLQTSLVEGTPNSLLEAQALGCPIVTTNAAGAAEAVAPDHTALLSPLASADQLAAHVISLLTNPALRHRLAAAGPSFVRQHYGLQRMIDQTAALYEATP